mgnify:CR=1 FL=1
MEVRLSSGEVLAGHLLAEPHRGARRCSHCGVCSRGTYIAPRVCGSEVAYVFVGRVSEGRDPQTHLRPQTHKRCGWAFLKCVVQACFEEMRLLPPAEPARTKYLGVALRHEARPLRRQRAQLPTLVGSGFTAEAVLSKWLGSGVLAMYAALSLRVWIWLGSRFVAICAALSSRF